MVVDVALIPYLRATLHMVADSRSKNDLIEQAAPAPDEQELFNDVMNGERHN